MAHAVHIPLLKLITEFPIHRRRPIGLADREPTPSTLPPDAMSMHRLRRNLGSNQLKQEDVFCTPSYAYFKVWLKEFGIDLRVRYICLTVASQFDRLLLLYHNFCLWYSATHVAS